MTELALERQAQLAAGAAEMNNPQWVIKHYKQAQMVFGPMSDVAKAFATQFANRYVKYVADGNDAGAKRLWELSQHLGSPHKVGNCFLDVLAEAHKKAVAEGLPDLANKLRQRAHQLLDRSFYPMHIDDRMGSRPVSVLL